MATAADEGLWKPPSSTHLHVIATRLSARCSMAGKDMYARVLGPPAMQDIYAFDVGDFGKLGLLRFLCHRTRCHLGVSWWKTELGSAGADGKHVGYLQEPVYRRCDPTLWDGMKRAFTPGSRCIRDLEQFLPSTTPFHHDPVPAKDLRAQWFSNVLRLARNSEVVFCDPDNGITTNSDSGSRQHVTLSELSALFDADASLVVYHTPGRVTAHDEQIDQLANALLETLPDGRVWAARFRRGTSRVFFVIAQPEHAAALAAAMNEMRNSPWCFDGHFDIRERRRLAVASKDPQRPESTPGSGPSPEAPLAPPSDCDSDATDSGTAKPVAGQFVVHLNDNGGLNVAANPWLISLPLPFLLRAPGDFLFRVDSAFAGRSDMFRVSPTTLTIARHLGFSGNHLSHAKAVRFIACVDQR